MTDAREEAVARALYEKSPDVFWNPHAEVRGHRHWGDLTEARRDVFRNKARALSTLPTGEEALDSRARDRELATTWKISVLRLQISTT